MKVFILDKNVDYSNRFKYYLGKKYTQLQISVCDNFETAKKLIQEEIYDVVLFDSEFDDADTESIKEFLGKSAFAYLSETNEIVNDTDTIMKYNRISEIFSMICSLYEKKKNRVIKQDDNSAETEKSTEIITFLPVHGGAGSSTMAAACAISLADEYDVLYINLEQRPSDSAFFEGESKKSLSDILSIFKTKYTDEGLVKVLKNIIQKDNSRPASKLHYIKGYTNIMDCLSMTEQNIEVLLKMIREKLKYRFVIIDADFIVNPILDKLIFSSDKMVFVTSGADISNSKLLKIQRYLDILKRNEDYEVPVSYLLLNQYYGLNDETSIARDMQIIAKIARYRTDDKTRITSKSVINEVLSKNDVFKELTSRKIAVSVS